MNKQLHTVVALLVAITLLPVLTPSWALPVAAQSQPAASTETVLSQAEGTVPNRAIVAEGLHNSSVMFIENVGQFADGARFQVRGADHTMWLADDAIWITVMEQRYVDPQERFNEQHVKLEREDEQLRGVNIKLGFVGANPNPGIKPFDRLDTHVSYFIGNDPDQWHSDVPVWGGVRYKDLYPGVDLEVTEEEDMWIWRLVTNDTSTLEDVRLQVEGADDLDLEDDLLHLTTVVGEHDLPLLLAVDSQGQPVRMPSGPSLTGHEIALPFRSSASYLSAGATGADDLRYATFLGGSDWERSIGIAVDSAGQAYVTGYTDSVNFPVGPGYDTSYAARDAFVVKLNASGTALLYATFLEGPLPDYGYDIAVDDVGQAYVMGTTWSEDFPAGPGYDVSHNGWYDAFAVKLNATGTMLRYATFLGGYEDDYGGSIAVDRAGQAYITGWTYSADFPAGPGYDTSCGTDGNCNSDGTSVFSDAFVAKLNAAGTALLYATFLGGSGHDWGHGIVVDGAGQAYVTGYTNSVNFPTWPGYDTSYNGSDDAFVAKLNASGTALLYATFLGGSGDEAGSGIAVDGASQAYVTGYTDSVNFPTWLGYDTSYNGSDDAFVAKLNASGTALLYATFLGGSGDEAGSGIAVDGASQAYVTGHTDSVNFPAGPGYDTSYNGNSDAFVAKLNATGSSLVYATFLGGLDDDAGSGIAVDGSGMAYVTGGTGSSNFPTTYGAHDRSHNGAGDAFVAKLGLGGSNAPNGLDVSQLERGDILLVNASWLLTPIVGSFGGYWGHTGMYAGDRQIVESINVGVIERPIDETTFWTARDWVVERVNTTELWKAYATAFARDQTGKPYSWDYLNKWRTDQYYCSQLVWRAYYEADVDIDSNWSIMSCLETNSPAICALLVASVPPDDIYYDDDLTEVQAKKWDAKRAVLYLGSPADLYITDPYGRHVGVDPNTGAVVEEIPEVLYYSGPDAEPEHVVIMDMEGSWDVKVIGRGSGSYTLVTEVVGLGEKHQVDYVTETTSLWQIDDYTLVYPTTPGDPIRISEHPVYVPLILRRR